MRLRKGDPVKTLPAAIASVEAAWIQRGETGSSLTQLREHEIHAMLRADQRSAVPEYYAFCRDTCRHVLVAPRPDKAYRLRLACLQWAHF